MFIKRENLIFKIVKGEVSLILEKCVEINENVNMMGQSKSIHSDELSKREITKEIYSIRLSFYNGEQSYVVVFEKDRHYHDKGGWEAWVNLFEKFAEDIKNSKSVLVDIASV